MIKIFFLFVCDFSFFFFLVDGKRNYALIEPLAFDGTLMQPITQGGGSFVQFEERGG